LSEYTYLNEVELEQIQFRFYGTPTCLLTKN